MVRVCAKCGQSDRFRAVQVLYAEVIVDGTGEIVEDLGVTDCLRPQVQECCACGSRDFVQKDEDDDAGAGGEEGQE